MQIYVSGRQEGKTTKMLEWMRAASEDETRVLVVHNEMRAMTLHRENPDLDSWQFVGWEEMVKIRGRHATSVRGEVVLGIDDLDLLLTHQFAHPIGRISITGEIDPVEMSPGVATKVVARWAVRQAVEKWSCSEDLWEEEFPDFGERDMRDIVEDMQDHLPKDVTVEKYETACKVLADRAKEAADGL